VLAQFLKGQVERLAAFQNRFDDIWRQERTLEDFSDIAFRQSGMPSKSSDVDGRSFQHFFMPTMGSRDRLYQRSLLVCYCLTRVRVWGDDQMNFATASFQRRFDGKADQIAFID
jgi:hypothetical protein